MRPLLLIALVLVSMPLLHAQKKVRPNVPEAATRCGADISWRTNVDEALAEAAKSNKPLFWYVPTVAGSRMDRKPVIDHYMMSGPFSAPMLATLIERRCVAVKAVASGAMAEKLGLKPLQFIEPGFVILRGDGSEVGRVQKISTFHEGWLLLQVRHLLQAAQAPESAAVQAAIAAGDNMVLGRTLLEEGAAAEAMEALTKARGDSTQTEMLRVHCLTLLGRDDEAVVLLEKPRHYDLVGGAAHALEHGRFALVRNQPTEALQHLGKARHHGPAMNEARMLHAVALRMSGDDIAARKEFAALAAVQPEDRWTRKAAAEAVGYGPFMRGFEVFTRLPAAAMCVATDGTRHACSEQDAAALQRHSVDLLLRTQRADGCWDDSNYDFGGTDSLPNVYMAGTALAALALHEARSVDPQRCDAAVARAMKFLGDEKHIAAEDVDELVWAHAYRLELYAQLLRETEGPKDAVLSAKARAVANSLEEFQLKDGGFRHEYPNPFATATAMVALDHIDASGVKMGRDALKRAAPKLAAARGDNGSFSYGFGRGGAGSAPGFSAGRSPICELALLRAGVSSQQRLLGALQLAEENHERLEAVRKYDDHADQFGNGGFFFWYALYGRMQAIDAIEDVGAREAAKARLRATVLAIAEIDFGFVDSHELGKSYGTAMGLLCLLGTAPKLP